MANEFDGTVFDLTITPTIDMTSVDKFEEKLNQLDGHEAKIYLDPEWTQEGKEVFNQFNNSTVKMELELEVPKTLNRTVKQLECLYEIMSKLSDNKSVNVSVANNTSSVAKNTSGSSSTTLPETKELKHDVEGLKSNVRGYINAINEIYRITDGLRIVDGQDVSSIKNDIDEINNNINNAVDYYEKILTYDPELFKNKKEFKGIDGLANIWNTAKEKYADSVYTAVKDIIEEAYESMEDAINSSADESLKGALEQGVISQKLFNIPIPKSKTVPVTSTITPTSNLDMSSLANAMSISFDDGVSREIKSDTKLIQRDVASIKDTLSTGIPVTGNIANDNSSSKPKDEKIKLDASDLINAITALSSILENKKAIIEQNEKNNSIINSPNGSVTAKQIGNAISDSENRVDAKLARNQTIINGVYNRTKKLVDSLQKENAEMYESLGKNFLDIPEKELKSFVEMIDKIQDKTITIDVDIPNIKDVQGLLLTLHKVEKAEKNTGKETKSKTAKSKTKAAKPAVASKGDSSGESNGVTLPKNLNITNEKGNELLTDIKTSVESIDSKLGKDGKASVVKSRTKKGNDDSSGIPAGALKVLSDSFSSFGDSIKQIESGVDLIFEQTNEVASNTKGAIILLNSIYNKISSGVTVSGGVPIPSSNNSPTPIPQGNNGGTPRNRGGNNPKPANTPPASIRSRDNIIDETNRLIPEIDSEIKKINYLLASEGGVSDAILSKDDAKDLLNRLKEVESEISNIQNAVWSKKVGQKTLAAADSDLTDIMSTYSSINIPQEVDTYNKVFGDSKSINRAKEMLGTLTRFKELLNTKGIDTTAYDEAIQRLKDGIERVEETKKSWMSQKLDDSGLKLANDALTQIRDSLDSVSDATESLFEYAKNEKSEFLSFDVKIDEVEELEKSLIRLDKLIKKAKFSGVDLTSVDIGNGQTLADAEKTIERYFSEKGSLSIYSPGQFASEDEFKSYREDIELNLIQPTKLYAKTLSETEYAVNQLIQEQKELAKASNEYNKGLTLNKQISNKITELEKWRDANSKAFTIPENAAEYERFMNRLKDGTIIDQSQMKKFNAEWAEFNAQIRAAGQNGKTTGSILTAMFKKFGGWTLVTRTITQGLRLMKDMVTQVKEVDTAMVNLRKVTDASEQSLLKYQKSVQKSSIALGTTLTDQIDSTATFSRLGYQLEEAQKLGEIASKYKTVAEDLDIGTASESIISTMKAYQSMGDTAEEIVDKFNYVGNNFAVSSSGLGESLQRSASALVAANNTLSEAIALTTAGNFRCLIV